VRSDVVSDRTRDVLREEVVPLDRGLNRVPVDASRLPGAIGLDDEHALTVAEDDPLLHLAVPQVLDSHLERNGVPVGELQTLHRP